ncbi:hypothetical protein BJ138DRAFT_1067926, partial [Hygrophoropsis aurantiaca]
MASMNGWQNPPPYESFSENFTILRYTTPPSYCASTKLESPSDAEKYESGPSLRDIRPLSLDSLSLIRPEHTRSWAVNVLSTNGPVGIRAMWQGEALRTMLPVELSEETEVVEYLRYAFFYRAMCAAVCLFLGSTQPGSTESCPSECRLVRRPNSGSSGRPDLQFLRKGKTCCAVECKTRRACDSSNGVDILERLGNGWADWTSWVDGRVALGGFPISDDDDSPVGVSPTIPWEQKAIRVIYQVWHQLLTRECEHSIICNESEFVLAHRTNGSLCISPQYSLELGDGDALRNILTDLSFFIAHSLIARFGVANEYAPAQVPVQGFIPTNIPPLAANCGPIGRSDTERTLRGVPSNPAAGSSASNLHIKAKSYDLYAKTITPLPDPSHTHSPCELVFTTSGCPSAVLPLLRLDQPNSSPLQPSQARRLTLTTSISHGGCSSVFRGHVDGAGVVVKMAEGDDDRKSLENEARIYSILQPLQGSAVPVCFGLFRAGAALYLLMEDCGHRLESFSVLNSPQRHDLLMKATSLHQLGVIHNDLEDRNVLVAGSTLRITDFGESRRGHLCGGVDQCPELGSLACALG